MAYGPATAHPATRFGAGSPSHLTLLRLTLLRLTLLRLTLLRLTLLRLTLLPWAMNLTRHRWRHRYCAELRRGLAADHHSLVGGTAQLATRLGRP